ncbi:hypothetical protein K533_24020 [Salmonella enterica subsp. enterica serovar Cubana str. CVM42234]|nr:hypothetical protein CFSAN002050_05890 [Salmonella enterica subsp. enterica serovar Cubana str. CFSAN002050]ESV49138.1 hypothetical protein K533_24020 [Salmonella enterica subsp. enterica serovar Cubana str. CVM42234]
MPLQSVGHFYLIAIIRSDKITANQQQDDICLGKVEVYLVLKLLPWNDTAIVPCGDLAHALQGGKMLLKLIAQRFVCMRIGKNESGHNV